METDFNPLFTLDDVLTPGECRAYIAAAEAAGFDEAPVTTARGMVRMEHIRNNTRVMGDDPALAAMLYTRMSARLPRQVDDWVAVGLNERLRWYRYDPGQYFALHRDGAFARSEAERSLYTVMIYLNDDFTGGRTRLLLKGSEYLVQPAVGRALVFWHPLLHEGETVESGRKYALRSDLMFRMNAA